MAATRARTELAASAPTATHTVKDVTSNREAASTDATINDQTPSRRTTTRARKLPSRLLPSPSPPPSRPSSLYNAAKHSKGGKDSSDSNPASPAVASPSPAAAGLSRSRKSDKPDDSSSSLDLESADRDDSADLGPGKRKRRPSSMYKPPATLTTVEMPSPASVSSASRSKKKGRSISPEAPLHKIQSPSAAVAQARLKGRLSKGKLEADNSSSKKGPGSSVDLDSLRENGGDSDAEHETGTRAASKRVRVGDLHDSMDFSPPPLLPRDGSARIQMPMHYSQPTFIRGGRVSVSPEASAKRPVRFGIRDETDTDCSRIGKIMRASKGDAQTTKKHSDVMSSSPVSAGLARFDNDAGTHLSYVPFRYGARTANGFHNLHSVPFAGRAVAEVDEDDNEDDDEDDDENDFHQAMLDADFDFFDSQKSDSVVVKPVWPVSRRATTEEADADDTPATTPRSPQSGCDAPSPASPRCKTEEDVSLPSADEKPSSFDAGRDSVFVHALPTTQVGADKPHQHAGSLTLSLPYSPAVAASSPHLRAMDVDSDAASLRKGVKDTNAGTQMGTPILQRRTHAGLPTGLHALAPLKLGADLMERSASNGVPSYMQLSPMIEMDSPLLSPGLSLSLQTRGVDLPSPFIMGVGSLPDLEQPAPLDLPPAEGSTTPKASTPEVVATGLDSEPSPAVAIMTESVQEPKAIETVKDTAVKAEKPSARRPALPPPRQIRFTTFTSSSVESAETKPQQQPEVSKPSVPTVHQQQPISQHPTRSKSDQTPELVHSGSASSESASDAPSPMSQTDSASSSADAEVENILFGPPEKLDMGELDHAWDGSKAGLRRAEATQVHAVDINAE